VPTLFVSYIFEIEHVDLRAQAVGQIPRGSHVSLDAVIVAINHSWSGRS
jgi:hypothetical protein